MNEKTSDIHRNLDGELTPGEQAELSDRVRKDDVLRREYEELTLSVRMLESSGRIEPPPGFTASVMRRLPAAAPSFPQRVRTFLFGRRVLHWNAAAVAAVAVAVLIGVTILTRLHRSAAPGPAMIVRLSLHAPHARTVAVAGSFNKWSAETDLLLREDGGRWTIDLPLKPGVYAYMFVIDGSAWVPDPLAESYQSDGFGDRNALLKVPI